MEKEKILEGWAKYFKVKIPKKTINDIATALEIQEIYENYERVLRAAEKAMGNYPDWIKMNKNAGTIIPYMQNPIIQNI